MTREELPDSGGSNPHAEDVKSNGATARQHFEAQAPSKHIERMQRAKKEKGEMGIALTELWVGIAAEENNDGSVDIGFACHDGTYTIDYAIHTLGGKGDNDGSCPTALPKDVKDRDAAIANYLVCAIRHYEKRNSYKFLGAGVSDEVYTLSPTAGPKLWTELDIVPAVFVAEEGGSLKQTRQQDGDASIEELADGLARKCLMHFGPNSQPRVQVGFKNLVEVDLAGRAKLVALEQYKQSVNERTWAAAVKYAESLKQNKTKIAFFSATPQGGGVALMRHALIRFFRLMGVNCTWWVPKPKPGVFRITKTNHNILQGVADPKEHLTKEQQEEIQAWIQGNADQFWTKSGGPLAARSDGGADIIIADDPQMPPIVDIAKKLDPERPVIFRSHIQVRSDLANKSETPTAGVWNWIWSSVQHADVFIAHPVRAFVPKDVPQSMLAYMPATTDWPDGLNKELSDFDTEYYLHQFNTECHRQRMTPLAYPKRDYIIQIARFDPSKGIPDVLAGYAEFRRNSTFCKDKPADETPQLVVCGHYSVDDPDGVAVLNETLEMLDGKYSDIKDSVVVMRLGPTDQILNVLMSNARIALQLSTREGFEVKVSEGLHKGVPVIATKAGGIPLQVQHEKSGFLVEPSSDENEAKEVAQALDTLFSDNARYKEMSRFAATHVSDEVGTVGNAVCWMYLADKLGKQQKKLEPNGKWIWDLAREEVGEPVKRHGEEGGEDWLPRDWTT